MIIILYLISIIASIVQTRLITREFQSVNLRQQKSWIYLDRMNFNVGKVQIIFQTHLRTQTIPSYGKYKLNLLMIPDYLWEIEKQRKCSMSQKFQTQFDKNISKTNNIKKQAVILTLNYENQLKNRTTFSFNIDRQATYYFVITDCDKTMVNQYFNKKSRFDIQVDIKNNGNNYGYDESMYVWLIPLLIGTCSIILHKLNKSQRNMNDFEDINWPIILYKIIIWAHILGLSFVYAGYIIYVLGRGKDISFFPFIFLISSTISQNMLLVLITFCSFGWMTTYQISQDQQIYYPIATVIGFINLVLAMLSKLNDGDTDKTHLYDGVTTYIQIVVKCICLCTFFIGIIQSYLKFKKNGPFVQYLKKLTIFGTFCYVSIPIVIWMTEYMDIHTRWVKVFSIVQILRTIQIVIIGYQIISKKSIYNQLTLHGKSFMQHDNKYL